MKTFVRYKNFWWEYRHDSPLDSARLFNMYGDFVDDGYFCQADIRDAEMVDADGYQDLDWEGTQVLSRNSRFGWVDRNGVFYGCDWRSHELQAYLIHKCDKRELEQKGWIHISAPSKRDSYVINALFYGDYKNGVMPTDKQMEYLCSRNDVQFSQVLEAYENGNRAKARIYEANLLKPKKNSKKDNSDLIM